MTGQDPQATYRPIDAEIRYPAAKKDETTRDYHGTPVADPYRWLEDRDSPARKEWVEAERKLAEAYLAGIPERQAIRRRLTSLWDYDKYGLPFHRGGRYFFTRKEGLQNQSVLFTTDTLKDEPRLLLDPNKLSEDGTTSVSAYAVSRNGKYLAYNISRGGSDWKEIMVRDVDSAEDLEDRVLWVKFSRSSWDSDGNGFYYSRYEAPDETTSLQARNEYQKLYYHRLGTQQDEDILIYERPDKKKWGFDGTVTEDGRYLVIEVWEGTAPKTGVFYKDLHENRGVVELLNKFDAAYHYVHNDGPLFYFFTDLDAPRGRLVAIHLNTPEADAWVEVIPEGESTLESIRPTGGRFVAHYLKDVRSQLKVFSTKGRVEKEIELPAMGSVQALSGRFEDPNLFYAFSSFTFPTTIYRYDFGEGRNAIFKRPQVDFNSEDFAIKQVFFKSRDGTRIPMFIAHRKGIALDGSNPTYLYGYGGFNASLTPSFQVPLLVWMEMGGVYAVPNIRGGGEYGEEWHQAGIKANKQNVFDDFIAAAEWLIANGYTSSSRLAIGGRSNGGLLVGACITQRPELFGAALPGVGVLDMLRFHEFTIGGAWVSEYGSPEVAEEFKALYAYSPYHNVRPGTEYPPTLVTTADHDDRVVPAHSYKFTAALQTAQAGANPVLIRIDTKAGHGAGKPTNKLIEEWTDKWGFLVRNLGMTLAPRLDEGPRAP